MAHSSRASGRRPGLRLAALAAAGCCAFAQAGEPARGELQLAWLDAAGGFHAVALTPDGSSRPLPPAPFAHGDEVPLGSLWKLAAYARLADNPVREGDYTCTGRQREEVYCCEPGQRISRGAALWRSCGLYFQPSRLGWDRLLLGETLQALPSSLSVLQQAGGLGERTRVPLADWLAWLGRWPAATRQQAQDDLAGYWLQGPGRKALGEVGGRLRLKTFTLERREPGAAGERWSGASGWTREGTPLWMAARGSSAQVVPTWAPLVLRHLDAQREAGQPWPAADGGASCVEVSFFSRYPLQAIEPAPAAEGVLPDGRWRVRFANGVQLDIESRRDLTWRRDVTGQPQLLGRFTLDDYVARVVDREGAGQPAAASQALSVAARSYVLANGQPGAGGCLAIADSSARQRVAPRPPTAAARAAVRHTADLVLQGAEGRYHSTRAGRDVMAWTDAVRAAEAGQGFQQILASAYPRATLATAGGRGSQGCEPLPQAEQWLAARRGRWQRLLAGEAGYTVPPPVQVCRLQQGRAHALRSTARIYAAGLHSLEDRLTLVHEFLHLAFSGHPRGADEHFIEQQARRLLGVD